jgi:hypothetical protein
VSWTQHRRIRRNAVAYAALRRLGRWFTGRRFLWLLCVASCGSVIWLAGSHLGPGLRAAHGQGVHGLWTAQERDSGQWYGEFVSISGTVTLPHVYYAGSLPAVQAGTTVPALDTGAGDEVYPLTGSGKWVHDVIGIVVGTLALIGLLAGFFAASRRRRAMRAGRFTQAIVPPERVQRLRRAVPRSRAGKLGVLALSIGAMGYICARFIVLLADVRPYTGWYWLLAVASGIGVAVALPWAYVRGARGSARWPGWLLVGYIMALAGGMRYYLSLRFTPPGSVPTALPPPPPWFVLEIAGLSAATFTLAAITLLLLAVMVEVVAPGPVGGWLLARRERRASASRSPGPVDERFPARLRLEAQGAPAGPWLRGEIHVRPGSLLWEPATGVYAVPVELAAAAIMPEDAGRVAKRGRAVIVDTPAGRVQLECDAGLLALLQRIAAELASSSQTTSAEAPGQPTGRVYRD